MNTRNPVILAVVLTVGMIGTMGILANTQGNVVSSEASDDVASITAHVIITVYDADGNIKAYRESDNLIVDVGKNCAPALLFGATSPNPGCYIGNAVSSVYDRIAVSTTTSDPGATAETLAGEINSFGLSRAQADSRTVSTLAAPASLFSETTLTKMFSVTGSVAVGSAGLFNSDTTSKMFAGKSFTPVSVINLDTLTVTWKIRLNQ